MVRKRNLHPKPIFDEASLLAFLAEHGAKPTHAQKIWRHLLQHPETPIEALPDLPRGLAAKLAKVFVRCTSEVVKVVESPVDYTAKLLIRLQDGKEIEAVLINHAGEPLDLGQREKWRKGGPLPLRPQDREQDRDQEAEDSDNSEAGECNTRAPGRSLRGEPRHALCISSQVGCRLGCTFCATGEMGLDGNLWSGEILEQVLHARARGRPVHSVVFMGMGEPLENVDAVIAAVNGLVDPHRFALAPRSVTVSTVGLVGQMRRLMREAPPVRLSLSLHAPSQALREQLVPVSKAYPLESVMSVIDEYVTRKGPGGSSRRRLVLVAYVLLDGVNDSEECASELAALVGDRPVVVNLIPYNEIESGGSHGYKTPSKERVAAFLRVLSSAGVRVYERRHHGRDIAAACGQLALAQKEARAVDIEDYDVGLAKEKVWTSAGVNQASAARSKQHTASKALLGTTCVIFGMVTVVALTRWRSWRR